MKDRLDYRGVIMFVAALAAGIGALAFGEKEVALAAIGVAGGQFLRSPLKPAGDQ